MHDKQSILISKKSYTPKAWEAKCATVSCSRLHVPSELCRGLGTKEKKSRRVNPPHVLVCLNTLCVCCLESEDEVEIPKQNKWKNRRNISSGSNQRILGTVHIPQCLWAMYFSILAESCGNVAFSWRFFSKATLYQFLICTNFSL